MSEKENNVHLFNLNDKGLIRFAHRNQNKFIMDTVAPEMMRRLIISIKDFNTKSSKYSKWIIGLTIILGFLAIIQVVILLLPLFS